jgi:hypothetical protein
LAGNRQTKSFKHYYYTPPYHSVQISSCFTITTEIAGAVVYRLAAKFPKWNLKVIHAAIMLLAIILCSIGVYVSFENHRLNSYPDLASVHSWIGLFTFIVFIVQVSQNHTRKCSIFSLESLKKYALMGAHRRQ